MMICRAPGDLALSGSCSVSNINVEPFFDSGLTPDVATVPLFWRSGRTLVSSPNFFDEHLGHLLSGQVPTTLRRLEDAPGDPDGEERKRDKTRSIADSLLLQPLPDLAL